MRTITVSSGLMTTQTFTSAGTPACGMAGMWKPSIRPPAAALPLPMTKLLLVSVVVVIR
jgi:hypothetical protein